MLKAKQADASAFAEAVGRYCVFYQHSANGWTPAARQRLLRAAAAQAPLDYAGAGAGEASGLSLSTT
jgi:hypothetical protein